MDFLKADDEIAAYLTEAYRDDAPSPIYVICYIKHIKHLKVL